MGHKKSSQILAYFHYVILLLYFPITLTLYIPIIVTLIIGDRRKYIISKTDPRKTRSVTSRVAHSSGRVKGALRACTHTLQSHWLICSKHQIGS